MAAFAPGTDKIVTSPTRNLKDAARVDARDMLSRMFIEMGLSQVTAGNTAPSSKDVLWWHIDVKALKRWDAVQGNWFPLTPNQYAMHMIRRAFLGSVTDINLETGDLFMFWDVSLGELKIITRDDLMKALGQTRKIETTEGVQGGGDLGANRTLKMDVNGLAAKIAPAGTDLVPIYSVTDGVHRKSTVKQIASSVAVSDEAFAMSYFLGMM